MKRLGIIGLALLGAINVAHAGNPTLLRAVNYVMSNDEENTVMSVVNEDECVFKDSRTGWEIYLNNIDPRNTSYERIVMGNRWITKMTVHGAGKPTSSWGMMESQIGFATGLDLDRHARAWQYIYGPGGCKAAQAAF